MESGAEGSGLKGTGPLFPLLLNKQTREEIVISKLNVIGVLSCVLGFGFVTAIQAAEQPSAPERMNPGHLAEGIETIRGEVVRLKGQHFYIRRSDGKEGHLHGHFPYAQKDEGSFAHSQGSPLPVQRCRNPAPAGTHMREHQPL